MEEMNLFLETRTKKNIGHNQMARELGFDPGQLSRILNEKVGVSLSLIMEIGKRMGLKEAAILEAWKDMEYRRYKRLSKDVRHTKETESEKKR